MCVCSCVHACECGQLCKCWHVLKLRQAFLKVVSKKGIFFLEMLAMELKREGAYVSRGLSFKKAEFETLTVVRCVCLSFCFCTAPRCANLKKRPWHVSLFIYLDVYMNGMSATGPAYIRTHTHTYTHMNVWTYLGFQSAAKMRTQAASLQTCVFACVYMCT